VVSRINSRDLRLLFCATLVAIATCVCFTSAAFRHHEYSWKDALAVAQNSASTDGAPILICSDLPEADHMTMPVGSAIEDSGILAPLSYYKLSVPVVPLPRALNDEAVRVGSRFLQQAAHRRFLALAFWQSAPTLDWLKKNAAATHSVRELGVFDGVTVLEFLPRDEAKV
jgi:hypothetical protein